jgi:hypothetical protein
MVLLHAVPMIPPLQTQPPLPWQWFNWWAWPGTGHVFATSSIWRPGFVPYRFTAWQPDIAPPTVARFNFDCLNWAAARGVRPNFVLNMNTGSVGVRSVA